jgi:hypothetical protein
VQSMYTMTPMAHGEVQEGHEAHQNDPHEQEVVLDALRSA